MALFISKKLYLLNQNIDKLSKMKIKYNTYSNIVFIFFIVLFLSSVISFIIIMLDKPMAIDCSQEGLENLFKEFKTTVKFITATIAMFVIWLTLERMKQTQEQLDTIKNSTNLNNFFIHKAQFINHMKKTSYIQDYDKLNIPTVENVLSEIYRYYYNPSFINFKPKLSTNANKKYNSFINDIRKSELEIKDISLLDIDFNTISRIWEHNSPTQIVLLKSRNKNHFNTTDFKTYLKLRKIPWGRKAASQKNYNVLFDIYNLKKLYDELFIFDGLSTEKLVFELNFLELQNDIKYMIMLTGM